MVEAMSEAGRYPKVMAWSEEDGCWIGSAPDLVLGGCHGPDERAVFAELCQIVEEAVALYHADGKPLPPADIARSLTDRLEAPMDRIGRAER